MGYPDPDASLSRGCIADLRQEIMREFRHVEEMAQERDKRYASRFLAADEAVQVALRSAKEAVTKAEAATEKRFENTNEWRQTVTELIAATQGRGTGLKEGWGYLIGGVGVGAVVLNLVLEMMK